MIFASSGALMHRFILPLLVVAGTLCLLGLGTWQMQRLVWKEALIAEREAGLAMKPSILPQAFADWENAKSFNFRIVNVTGVFRHDLEQLFGAKARGGVLGHHVLTPLLPSDGPAVLVDRGWVPADKAHPASRPEGQIEGEVTVGGIARFRAADRPGAFTPNNDPTAGEWYHYDLDAMAAALGLELSPVVIEVDDTPNPGGLPIGGRTVIQLTNNHQQYALTWYGLAAALGGGLYRVLAPTPGADRARRPDGKATSTWTFHEPTSSHHRLHDFTDVRVDPARGLGASDQFRAVLPGLADLLWILGAAAFGHPGRSRL